MPHKSRKQKADEYAEKYSGIPVDYRARMEWLYDTLHIDNAKGFQIMQKRSMILSQMEFFDLDLILFEVPEGTPRPRFRMVTPKNYPGEAVMNSAYVHVYSLTGAEDNKYMRRLVDTGEIAQLNNLICTPCVIDINTFFRTPSSYNREDTILAEIGVHRPVFKPDFDNLAKKYCDMFNLNVWLDDAFVVDGSVHKYYSVLPRIEIHLRYLNRLYNRHQYNAVTRRVDFDPTTQLSYFGKEC